MSKAEMTANRLIDTNMPFVRLNANNTKMEIKTINALMSKW